MNVLGCLDRLSSGEHYLDGQNVSRLDDDSLSELRLRYLGFIFQSFNLIPQFRTYNATSSCRSYYLGWDAMPRHRASSGSWRRRSGWATELPPALVLPDLSGGQMQRVAIARP